jgi:hypothetical protein
MLKMTLTKPCWRMPFGSPWFYLGVSNQAMEMVSEDENTKVSASGQASVSFDIIAPSAPLARREVRVATVDAREHNLLTVLSADGN